jgi:hypothetical protein
MTKRKDFRGILCHLEFVIQTVFAFGSYTKLCVIYALSSELDEFSCIRLSVIGAAEARHARPWNRRFAQRSGYKYKQNSRRADLRGG